MSIQFVLSDGALVTVKEVAAIVGITVCGARHRLRRSDDPQVVLAKSGKTTNHNDHAEVFVLSNGLKATVRELRELTSIKENTIRGRLKVSRDYEYVTRPLVFEHLDANIYIFDDGSQTTVSEFALARGISQAAAHSLLQSMNLKTTKHRKKYLLDDGQEVTLEQVMKLTNTSKSGAKKRVNKSTDPAVVLAPIGTRRDKQYTLSDGACVTAKEVMNATGLVLEVAKLRLQQSTDREVIFKPHFCKAKRFVVVTRQVETEHGYTKTTSRVRAGELGYR